MTNKVVSDFVIITDFEAVTDIPKDIFASNQQKLCYVAATNTDI